MNVHSQLSVDLRSNRHIVVAWQFFRVLGHRGELHGRQGTAVHIQAVVHKAKLAQHAAGGHERRAGVCRHWRIVGGPRQRQRVARQDVGVPRAHVGCLRCDVEEDGPVDAVVQLHLQRDDHRVHRYLLAVGAAETSLTLELRSPLAVYRTPRLGGGPRVLVGPRAGWVAEGFPGQVLVVPINARLLGLLAPQVLEIATRACRAGPLGDVWVVRSRRTCNTGVVAVWRKFSRWGGKADGVVAVPSGCRHRAWVRQQL